MIGEYVPAPLDKWKAHVSGARHRFKKGVMMTERNDCRVVRDVRLLRRGAAALAQKVSEARSNCLALMENAQEAGESELARCLSDVWNSLGIGVDCLFDAWSQLVAIEKEVP